MYISLSLSLHILAELLENGLHFLGSESSEITVESCTHAPTLRIYLLVGYLTMLRRQDYRTRMAQKPQDNKLERAWKKKAML